MLNKKLAARVQFFNLKFSNTYFSFVHHSLFELHSLNPAAIMDAVCFFFGLHALKRYLCSSGTFIGVLILYVTENRTNTWGIHPYVVLWDVSVTISVFPFHNNV